MKLNVLQWLPPGSVILAALLIYWATPLAAQVLPVATSAPKQVDERPVFPAGATVLRWRVRPDGILDAVISLPATQNVFVASNQPDTNFGGGNTLLLGYNSGGDNLGALRILLLFDFPDGIPAGAEINSATIQLYLSSATGETSMNTIARFLQSPWDEQQVTWNSHEPNWGGVSAAANVDSSPGWSTWDVTGLASEWLNGITPNDGVILIGDEIPSEHQRIFWSVEAGNALLPQLIVDYSAPIPDSTPPTSRMVHPMDIWQPSTVFLVEWSGSDDGGAGIAYYDVQLREPGQDWQTWLAHTQADKQDFTGVNGHTYQFRVRAVDNAGNVEPFPDDPEASTTVDTTPPAASIAPLPPFLATPDFTVSWSGSDAISGIKLYNLQFRYGDQPWQDWLIGTTQTSASASGENGVPIYFRVQAKDNAGNVSAWDSPGMDTGTTVDTTPPATTIRLPNPITTEPTFAVSWSGNDGANGSGIRYYNVRYNFNGGAWLLWQQETLATSATFTAQQGGGFYIYQVQAMDNVGNQSDFTPPTGAAEVYNTGDTLFIYLPLAFNSGSASTPGE